MARAYWKLTVSFILCFIISVISLNENFSSYFNYSLSRNGKEEKHGDSFEKDYLTDLLANESMSFINENAKEAKQQPFFMMIATPGYNNIN